MILNEKDYVEDIISGKNKEIKSIVRLIGYITRYHYSVYNNDDDVNYRNTVRWMEYNQNNFEESCYSNVISKAIKSAHKYPLYNLDYIEITKRELETIKSLDDLRAEKILFVLLCMAKLQSVSKGFTDGLVKYTLTDLCKQARISVPKNDREYIIFRILQKGLISCPKKNDTKCLKVNFIDDGKPELKLNNIDCQELAYTYLSWKNNGNGYGRCELCGRMIKQSKTKPRRFCKECSERIGNISDDMRVFECEDCHELVCVNKFNTKSDRCEKCYEKYRRNKKAETMRKLRNNG